MPKRSTDAAHTPLSLQLFQRARCFVQSPVPATSSACTIFGSHNLLPPKSSCYTVCVIDIGCWVLNEKERTLSAKPRLLCCLTVVSSSHVLLLSAEGPVGILRSGQPALPRELWLQRLSYFSTPPPSCKASHASRHALVSCTTYHSSTQYPNQAHEHQPRHVATMIECMDRNLLQFFVSSLLQA